MINFTPPNWLKKVKPLKDLRDYVYYRRRSIYFKRLRKIINPTTSIIANACYGGRLASDLGYIYNSPCVGLYFTYPDYIKFLANLKEYMNAPMIFRERSKYPECQKQQDRTPWKYPIGVLTVEDDEIEIQFLHYHSKEEALSKWERRRARMNYDDLLILGVDQDNCTEIDIKRFLELPYKHKYFFTSHNYFPDKYDDGFRYDKKMRFNKETVFHKAHTIYSLLLK